MPFAGQNQFFDAKTTFYILLGHVMYKITQKITKNHVIKGGLPAFRCLFCSVCDGKSCLSIRKSISSRERRVEHLFAGQNTQHLTGLLF